MDNINAIFPILYVYDTINTKYCDADRESGLSWHTERCFRKWKMNLK